MAKLIVDETWDVLRYKKKLYLDYLKLQQANRWDSNAIGR